MSTTPVLDALRSLTFADEIPEGELVSDAIVITRLVHAENGRESFHIAANSGISLIVQLGLIDAARTAMRSGEWSEGDSGD